MSVTAPYRFVPLSKLVLLPDWADQVSHDQPLADGLCGELKLRLTCRTPLCVGGEQDKSSEPGKVHFFRTPNRQLAIPGSSLKGMLRNVLEIASFARFKQVGERRLGVRDISEAGNFYATAIVSSPVHAGWLTFIGSHWQIHPCEFSRLHQEKLIEHCKVAKAEWKGLKTSAQRYKRIGICPEMRFNREAMPKKAGHWLAQPAPNGTHHGHVVVTGQPGKAFDEAPKAKKYEFVFHGIAAQPLPVDPAVMAGFRQIHEDSDEWRFWSENLTAGQLPLGIPVFFHKDSERVKSLGLAMMYKLPYSHSLHDAIRHTHDEHLGNQAPDLPDLIFGHLGEGECGGLRGRINIGLASLAEGQAPDTRWEGPCILNSPKPTFYPAYIRQDGKGNSFRQLMERQSELAGWKRYPVKAFEMRSPEGTAASSNKVQVRLETVPEGTTFTSTLRFHNLRRVELGALLWALDFGGRQDHRHGLGMGKPFGLGQVSLSIEGQRLRANDPAEAGRASDAEYLQACRREFVDLMEQTLQAAGESAGWDKCGPLKALLEHAKPAHNNHGLDYLPEPRAFVELRRRDYIGELQESFHKEAGVTPMHGFDTTQPHGYQSRFAEHLEQAGTVLQQQAAKAELEQRKANATEEEARLLEIAALGDICLGGSATGSQKDKLAKDLNKAHATSMDLDEAQKDELRRLADHCSQIDNKKILQACKKILRDVQPIGA